MITPAFHPFEDRLSRDIRNKLSTALAKTIENNNREIIQKTAASFLSQNLAPFYIHYIESRTSKYKKALTIMAKGSNEPFWRGLVLWDLELFFEVHEVLEHAWYTAEGAEKRMLQAMIRAAGVYIKLEFGYRPQAVKMATRALAVLEADRHVLTPYCDPDVLIEALHTLEPTPPKLLRLS